MPRRILDGEVEDNNRWIISYADFITLLFAFFVVMYSVSSVHEEKYEILTEALGNIFFDSKEDVKEGKGQGYLQNDGELVSLSTDDGNTYNDVIRREELIKRDAASQDVDDSKMSEFRSSLIAELDDLVVRGEVAVVSSDGWLSIDMNSNYLFKSGEANPNNSANEITEKVSRLLLSVDYPIYVEGFTDNIPINNSIYPSNWELSAARAAAIVRLLAENEIEPNRMAAVGYGEYKPVASNENAVDRGKNRRVSIVIYTNKPDKESL